MRENRNDSSKNCDVKLICICFLPQFELWLFCFFCTVVFIVIHTTVVGTLLKSLRNIGKSCWGECFFKEIFFINSCLLLLLWIKWKVACVQQVWQLQAVNLWPKNDSWVSRRHLYFSCLRSWMTFPKNIYIFLVSLDSQQTAELENCQKKIKGEKYNCSSYIYWICVNSSAWNVVSSTGPLFAITL